jgi:hypothetical protein
VPGHGSIVRNAKFSPPRAAFRRDVIWGDDLRFKAFVANSPQGLGRLGIHAASWDKSARPVLIQTGSDDTTDGEDANCRRDAFVHVKGPSVYEQFLNDDSARHAQFSLEQAPGIEGNELALATTAGAILDAYLKERQEALDWVASDAVTKATSGVSVLSRK